MEVVPSLKPSEGIKEALEATTAANRSLALLFLSGFSLIVSGGLLFLFTPHNRQTSLISPLSAEGDVKGALSLADASEVTSTREEYPPNAYFPTSLESLISDEIAGITATSYAAMERGSGRLLLAKNLTRERPIASLTKVMTAVVALESTDLSSEFLVSDSATKAGEAAMGLSAGERVTLEELLYGLLLPSGNDAGETLAEGLFTSQSPIGGVAADTLRGSANILSMEARAAARVTFIAKMNAKARLLGMRDTHYVNPTGLDGDSLESSSYSTALDLLALGNYALGNETLKKIVSTKYMSFPYKANYHKTFYLTNILGLRQSYPGVAGIKPGNTDLAKETLLSFAANGGKEVILVLLGSERTRDDAVKLYDLIFAKLGVTVKGK